MIFASRTDRIVRYLFYAFGLAILATLAVTVLVFIRAGEGNATTAAIARNGEMQGCRSELFVNVSRAQTDLDRARTDLEVVNAKLFAAALAGDTAGRDAAGARLIPIAQQIEAFTQQLEVAQVRYEDGVTLSRTQPAVFLDDCRNT